MLQIRKSGERGRADHGWLLSRHTFSFADYYDRRFMGFRSLRVINEDRIQGGSGFGAHPHRDMEIISVVVRGALEHKDSMGTMAVILPGEIQRMTAGRGVVHSEYNKLPDEETHFFQIWILPKVGGARPGYGQKSFEADLERKNLVLVVSENGRDGSIPIQQDADVYMARMKAGDELEFAVRPGRGVWIQVVRGKLSVNHLEVETGDGVAAEDDPLLRVKAKEASEILVFDLL